MKVLVTSNLSVSVVHASGRLTLGDGEDVLVGRVRDLLEDGERRLVLHLDGLIHHLFERSGLDHALEMFEVEDDAVSSFF